MKYFFKKYWIHLVFLLIIYIPILIITITRTDYALTLKGDTKVFNSVVEVNSDYVEEGSFSTIYVITMDKSTIFQNLITKNDPTVEQYKMSTSYTHLNDLESYNAGKIQYYSSLEISIWTAYTEAKKINSSINIDYSFASFDVTWYKAGSQFRIGDKIIGMNDIDNSNRDTLYNGLRNLSGSDVFHIIRDGNKMDITWDKDLDAISIYERYDINYDTISPSIKVNFNNVGGPSGGLLQTLSIYNRLVEEDLTHGLKIAGTGTINSNGYIGTIGGIREKIPTALDDNMDIFLCAKGNYDDALEAYNSLNGRAKMKLVCIEKFSDAIDYLRSYEA